MNYKLVEIVSDPALISSVSKPEISTLLGELETLRAQLWSRLAEPTLRDTAAYAEDQYRLLKVEEVAERLAFRPAYLYELIRQGAFPAIRQGKYIRIRMADLEQWIRRRASG